MKKDRINEIIEDLAVIFLCFVILGFCFIFALQDRDWETSKARLWP